MIPLALALGSSLAWGLADFLGGLKTRTLALPTVLLLSQAVGLAIAGLVVVAGEPLTSDSGTLAWAVSRASSIWGACGPSTAAVPVPR